MKVAHIIPNFNIGGVQKLILRITSSVDKARTDHIVVAMQLSDNLLQEEFKMVCKKAYAFPLVRELPYFRPYFLYSKLNNIFKTIFSKVRCIKLLHELHKEKIDILHIHTFEFNALYNLLKYSNCFKVNSIVSFHGNTNYSCQTWDLLIKIIKKYGKKKITQVSNNINKILIKMANQQNVPIDIIPNGLDLTQFYSDMLKKNEYSGDDLRQYKKELIIICVGRLNLVKGQDILLKAFSQMKSTREIRLILVGDGKERKNLELLVNDLALGAKVTFLGMRTDVPILLKSADIFVLPSRSEGEPLALIEALAAGLPVVVTDVGSCGSIIKNGESGFVVPPEDIHALTKALDLLVDNSTTRNMFSKVSVDIAKNYSIDKTIRLYQDLYQDMIR